MTEPSKAPEPFLKPYDPEGSESAMGALWEESGYANPDVCIEKGVTKPDAESYSIVLPPSNVTGPLHMGHAARGEFTAPENIEARGNLKIG